MRSWFLRTFFLSSSIVFCLLGLAPSPSAAQSPATNLIVIQPGAIPILITAPHGGTQPIPGVPNRTEGTTSTDVKTLELATSINQRLTQLLGAQPYLVGAKFLRRSADANRTPAEAFQHENARPVYEAYHGQIRRFVDDIRQKYPQGALMIDVHGQSKGTNTIFRGTRNGVTVMRLVRERGVDALIGTNSVLGRLQAAGYDIFPLNTPPGSPPEDRSFNGGFTVGTYGSHTTNGIDALQIEFGTALRADARRDQVANDVADAIAAYYRAFLAPQKK
jgi:N-formylglutamate amidohydrolase